MKKQTAMQQLKDNIQVVIDKMNGELLFYEKGYKQCLINIQNDIDLQMLAIEKEQIMDAVNDSWNMAKHSNFADAQAKQYYNETYGGDK
jgi:hypothetical protein